MNHQRVFFHKLAEYYGIPHELIHVLAYQIIKKPYRYQWGDDRVIPLAYETETRGEKLFVTLLPFMLFMGAGLFLQLLWILSAFFIQMRPEQYFSQGPTWHFLFFVSGAFFIAYAGTAHYDLIKAYHLLFGKNSVQQHGPKPHRTAKDDKQQGEHPQTTNRRMM